MCIFQSPCVNTNSKTNTDFINSTWFNHWELACISLLGREPARTTSISINNHILANIKLCCKHTIDKGRPICHHAKLRYAVVLCEWFSRADQPFPDTFGVKVPTTGNAYNKAECVRSLNENCLFQLPRIRYYRWDPYVVQSVLLHIGNLTVFS